MAEIDIADLQHDNDSFFNRSLRFTEEVKALSFLMFQHLSMGIQIVHDPVTTFANFPLDLAKLGNIFEIERQYYAMGQLARRLFPTLDDYVQYVEDKKSRLERSYKAAEEEIMTGRINFELYFCTLIELPVKIDSPYKWYTYKDGYALLDVLLGLVQRYRGTIESIEVVEEKSKDFIGRRIVVRF